MERMENTLKEGMLVWSKKIWNATSLKNYRAAWPQSGGLDQQTPGNARVALCGLWDDEISVGAEKNDTRIRVLIVIEYPNRFKHDYSIFKQMQS